MKLLAVFIHSKLVINVKHKVWITERNMRGMFLKNCDNCSFVKSHPWSWINIHRHLLAHAGSSIYKITLRVRRCEYDFFIAGQLNTDYIKKFRISKLYHNTYHHKPLFPPNNLILYPYICRCYWTKVEKQTCTDCWGMSWLPVLGCGFEPIIHSETIYSITQKPSLFMIDYNKILLHSFPV